MAETETSLDKITGLQSVELAESRISEKITSLLGRRTLAMVEQDASFDPDQYDPAFDEADFEEAA